MKKTKRIIFVGNPTPGEPVEATRAHNVNIADNIAQNSMIKGLNQYYREDLKVISVSSGRDYIKIDLGYGVTAEGVPSWGFHRALYYLSITKNYTLKLNKILRSIPDDNVVVITGGPYIYMAIPVMVARLTHKLKWIPFLIGAVEVPEEKFPYNMVSKLSRMTIKKADGAITYVSRSAIDYIPEKPFVEIFYLIDDELMRLYRNYAPQKSSKLTITYTGALTDIYNISTVISVIKRTGNKYRWVFAGVGRHAEEINLLSQNDKYDVEYMGAVSNIEAIQLQKSSHILLCLKGGDSTAANEYYSKYAASGKLIEYLCSGTPILVSDILAFSDKLKSFMTSPVSQNEDDIIRAISAIESDYDIRKELANKGRRYAFNNFNSDKQSQKIYDFLEKL